MSGIHRCRIALAAAFLGLLTGCDTLNLAFLTGNGRVKSDGDSPTRPTRYSFRLGQYAFFSDFELKRDEPLFQELGGLRDQVARELHLVPADTLIQVYIFREKERYQRFMRARYPGLPERRAFFVAQPHSVGSGEDLLVFTSWSPRIRQDLRHELTHALLHTVLKDVPLWLDEGIAEYFELPPAARGVNAAHVKNLARADHRPNLSRLEQLSAVGEMHPAEYQEAWAWVYLMLHGAPEGREVLLGYLQELRTNPNPGPMSPRLAAAVPSSEEALKMLMARLDGDRGALPALRAREDHRMK
jgi:hypothetical protein